MYLILFDHWNIIVLLLIINVAVWMSDVLTIINNIMKNKIILYTILLENKVVNITCAF